MRPRLVGSSSAASRAVQQRTGRMDVPSQHYEVAQHKAPRCMPAIQQHAGLGPAAEAPGAARFAVTIRPACRDSAVGM